MKTRIIDVVEGQAMTCLQLQSAALQDIPMKRRMKLRLRRVQLPLLMRALFLRPGEPAPPETFKLLEYPVARIDGDGRACFRWDRLLWEQPAGRYDAWLLDGDDTVRASFQIDLVKKPELTFADIKSELGACLADGVKGGKW